MRHLPAEEQHGEVDGGDGGDHFQRGGRGEDRTVVHCGESFPAIDGADQDHREHAELGQEADGPFAAGCPAAERPPLAEQLGQQQRQDDEQHQADDDGLVVDVCVDAGEQPQPARHDEEADQIGEHRDEEGDGVVAAGAARPDGGRGQRAGNDRGDDHADGQFGRQQPTGEPAQRRAEAGVQDGSELAPGRGGGTWSRWRWFRASGP